MFPGPGFRGIFVKGEGRRGSCGAPHGPALSTLCLRRPSGAAAGWPGPLLPGADQEERREGEAAPSGVPGSQGRELGGGGGQLCIWATESGLRARPCCDLVPAVTWWRGGASEGESRCVREALAERRWYGGLETWGASRPGSGGTCQGPLWDGRGWGEADGAAQVSEFYSVLLQRRG